MTHHMLQFLEEQMEHKSCRTYVFLSWNLFSGRHAIQGPKVNSCNTKYIFKKTFYKSKFTFHIYLPVQIHYDLLTVVWSNTTASI